ncbi:glycosyltransferase [Kibdelosporangium aridum]|uniref:Glycosyltransferase n=1 Tax=Kibdelosporangium aridum TaxID=2030 RepID=A0A428Z4W6_KIBAR|nr:glycosyltransferase [Kibdelosporangium aridum]RSM81645.1 glycosyltransferase [Kibdelosporangium aridum]
MKFLFVVTGSYVNMYASAPLATAVRNAGHEVILATTNEPMMDAAREMGIPAISMMSETIRSFLPADPSDDEERDTGHGLARMAVQGLESLLEITAGWRPDVVVGSAVSYMAGLLATRLGVPYVRYVEYLRIPLAGIDSGAEEGLLPELRRMGLTGLPEPAMYIDVCPPSLRRTPAPPAQQRMRFLPKTPQRALEPWMFTRPKGRRRVLITSGTHFRMLTPDAMRHLVDQLVLTGAEVLIAAPKKTAEELGDQLGDVRIGWLPLDVVIPTCDLVVHHCGATTGMTMMSAGVPQLIVPAPNPHNRAIAEAVSGFGAAIVMLPEELAKEENPAEAIAAGCREILADPRYTERAQALGNEMAALPAPAEVVRELETLVG